LQSGCVVAAATESSFGLLADARSSSAIDALLRVKPRGHDKGMPLILPSRTAWPALVREIPELARRLADAFWPGPLTIALDAAPDLDPRLLLEGSIAVRLPGACVAAEIAAAFGGALTATSANPPGLPPALTHEEALRSLESSVKNGDLVIIAGRAPGALPSTVVSVKKQRVEITRASAIPREAIEELVRQYAN
jgi:L-threonylcarbamoyladenylate synthase